MRSIERQREQFPFRIAALTTETLGQNSSLILNGHFGPNKIGIIPRELTARRHALNLADDTAIGDYAPGPIKVPETRSLPKYYDPDQGEYLPKFSPTGINPRPDTSARPSIQWSETAPPQDTLPLGVDAYRDIGDGEAVPVDRKPTTLYRGIKVNMFHPELGSLRRALFGKDKEWYLNDKGVFDNDSYSEYDWDDLKPPRESTLFDGDPDDYALSSGPLLTQPQGVRTPFATALGHQILDHLQSHHDEHDLGTHWTINPKQAGEFANYYKPHEIPVRLHADWRGEGEDPYRRDTNGHWHDEQEITLLPGAPVNVHTVEVMHPNTGDWYPIRLHTPSPRTASRNR